MVHINRMEQHSHEENRSGLVYINHCNYLYMQQCKSVRQANRKKIKKYTLVKINLIATIITVSMWISDG